MDKNIKHPKLFNILSWGVLGVTAVIAVFVGISSFKTMKQFETLSANYANAAGEAEEIYQTIVEIKSLYDTYGIQGNADTEASHFNAVYGYVAGLNDKYSFYYDPSMYEDRTNQDNESGFGIGIYVTAGDEGIEVLKVYKNSPAEKAGIKKGDLITKVDNTEYKKEEYNEFIALIKGNEGDTINVTVNRNGEAIEKSAVISSYTTNSVDYYLIDDKAVITITEFTLKTADEFKDAISECVNNNIDKFVVDLRFNGGGFIDTVIEMIDYVVPSGIIVQSLDRDRNVVDTTTSDSREVAGEFVVITNEGTASASELFAQSIKDFNKGTTVGTQSYGKSTIVGVYELKNGGSVRLSTGYTITNSGIELEGVGVTPDIEVQGNYANYTELLRLDPSEDIQLQTALEQLED